jgi:hypothetical protein
MANASSSLRVSTITTHNTTVTYVSLRNSQEEHPHGLPNLNKQNSESSTHKEAKIILSEAKKESPRHKLTPQDSKDNKAKTLQKAHSSQESKVRDKLLHDIKEKAKFKLPIPGGLRKSQGEELVSPTDQHRTPPSLETWVLEDVDDTMYICK